MVLNPPTLIFGSKNYKYSQYLGREVKHVDPIKLKDGEWTFVYAESNYSDAETVLNNFSQAQKAMGIEISKEPAFIEVPD
jgi:hypothetical protein